MDKPFIYIPAEHFSIDAYDIKPIDGYEEPVGASGDPFPYCCLYHKTVFEEAEHWFTIFPNCCDKDKKLAKSALFDKSKYFGVPLKIVTQVSYTEHQLTKYLNDPGWYKYITDYIEYNYFSFGQPAVGLHIYLNCLIAFIKSERIEFTNDKRQILLKYIDSYYHGKSDPPGTDWNILYSAYQNWLKAFPFELTRYFGNLKEQFDNKLPILNGPVEVNIYSKLAKASIHTKSSFFDALINLTNDLLSKISGSKLYEQGLITDADQIKVELANSSRKLKLTKGYNNSSPDEEHRYRKMIKDWLKDEKEYFNEISPLLKPKQPQSMESSIDPIKYMEFKKSSFYSNLLEENNFTTEEADELYQVIIDTIKLLEKLRSDELKSHNLIIKRAKGLDKNPIFDRISRMFQHWLVKALKNDDSYVYAYNYLAQKTNREMHMKAYDIKIISDAELFFILQKETKKNKKTEPTIIHTEPPVSEIIHEKLTLNEYKIKLDSTINYYSYYPLIVKSIRYNEKDILINTIHQLKINQKEVFRNESMLTEQIHFDLGSHEINLFYKYGIKKIDKLIYAFNHFSEGIVNWFNIEIFDKEIFDIWHKYSTSDSILIIFSDRPTGFVKYLHQSLKRSLKSFEIEFKNSYSLSNGVVPMPLTSANKKKQNFKHNSSASADSNNEIYTKIKSPDSTSITDKSSNSTKAKDIALRLFNFNIYFTLESKTESIPFKTIPGNYEREVNRKDANAEPNFQYIFIREYNNFISNGSPISYIAFCNLEFKKINKWIKEYEDLTEAIDNKDLNPVYPDGYRRALSYNEYLTKLKMTCDFYFMDTPHLRIARGQNIIFEDDDEVNKDDDINEDIEISTSLLKNGKLAAKLKEFNFFDLQKVTDLPVSSQSKLLEFLDENDIPYKIAMFNYLGFINYFEQNHCDNKKDMHKKLASILGSTDRTIKGNVNVLSVISKDNKERYTSHKYINTVSIDYNKLK